MLGPDDSDELRDDLVDGAAARVDREMRLAIVRLAPAKERAEQCDLFVRRGELMDLTWTPIH